MVLGLGLGLGLGRSAEWRPLNFQRVAEWLNVESQALGSQLCASDVLGLSNVPTRMPSGSLSVHISLCT